MKRLLLALLPALLTLTAFAQNQEDKPYQTKTFTGKFSALRVETSGGNITVEGGSRADIKVDLYVKPNNSNWSRNTLSQSEIEERLKQYDIVVRTEGNTVIATARAKERNIDWKRSLNIAFRVYTPRQMSTTINTSGGGIQLSHLTGRQNFTTSGGGLDLADLDGDLKGRTSGGGIRLTDCHATASGDRLELETSGGSIEAANASGLIHLETSGGGIRMRMLNGLINAQTSGGSISGDDIAGELVTTTSGGGIRLLNMAGSLEATTSAGSVDLQLTKIGKYLRLSTSAGSVRVQMPLNNGMNLDISGDRVSMPLRNFDGTSDKDRVKGKLNGGGIPVAISASSGSVSVND